MSDFETLIARLQERVHSPEGSTDSASDYPPHMRTPPILPLSSLEMAESEAALGVALPPLLYRLYSEVGNGGWGPGYGLEPLQQTVALWEERGKAIVTVVTRAKYFQEHDPKMVPLFKIADWGCAISSWVDTHHPDLPVVRSDPNLEDETVDQVIRMMGQEPETNPYHFLRAWRERTSLQEWLQAWVDGEDLWSLGFPREWVGGE